MSFLTRRVRMVALVVALVLVAAFALRESFHGADAELPQGHASVVLTDDGFMPMEVTIKLGGTVTFSTTRGKPFWPASDPHPSHSIYPEFDPRDLIPASGQWEFRFDRIGDWGYHDHLRSYYTGIVHVVQ